MHYRVRPIYRGSLRPGVVGLLQVGLLSTETSETPETMETLETSETMETSTVPPYDRYNRRASRLVGASACLRPGVAGLLQIGFLSTETPETPETLETLETSVVPPYGRHDRRSSRLVGASACLRPGVVGVAFF